MGLLLMRNDKLGSYTVTMLLFHTNMGTSHFLCYLLISLSFFIQYKSNHYTEVSLKNSLAAASGWFYSFVFIWASQFGVRLN